MRALFSGNRVPAAVIVLALMLCGSAFAEEGIPFPELNTEFYCTELVSKMLDKAEQRAEKDKCLADEIALKRKLLPLWPLMTQKTQEYVVENYFTEEKYHTYHTVAPYVWAAVGRSCVDGRMSCSSAATKIDENFSVLRSDFYCYAKIDKTPEELRASELRDCLATEADLKAGLAPYWYVVRPETKNSCLALFMNMTSEHSPFDRLVNCVATDVGYQCFEGNLDCKLMP